jgi:hypothetical protein
MLLPHELVAVEFPVALKPALAEDQEERALCPLLDLRGGALCLSKKRGLRWRKLDVLCRVFRHYYYFPRYVAGILLIETLLPNAALWGMTIHLFLALFAALCQFLPSDVAARVAQALSGY